MWQLKNIAKNKVKQKLDFRSKQPGELSTTALAKALDLNPSTLLRMGRKGVFTVVPSYRELIINNHRTFVMKKNDLKVIKKIVSQFRKQSNELSTTDLSEELSMSAAYLVKLSQRGKFKNIESYRELEISGHATFVIKKKDIEKIKKIIGLPKQSDELSTTEMAKILRVSAVTLVKYYHDGHFNKIKSCRELIHGGKKSFVVKQDDIPKIKKILGEPKNSEELSSKDLAKILGISSGFIVEKDGEGLFNKIESYRRVIKANQNYFVIAKSDLPKVYLILENILWKRTFSYRTFSEKYSTLQFRVILVKLDQKGSLNLPGQRVHFSRKISSQKLTLVPARDNHRSNPYFYVLPHWPVSLYESTQEGWHEKPQNKEKIDLNKAIGLLIYNRSQKKLVFKRF